MSFQPILSKSCKSSSDLNTKSSQECSNHNSSTSESENSEDFVVHDVSSEDEGNEGTDGILGGVEKKIDKLSDLFMDQCRLLTEIKEEVRESKAIIEKSEQAQNKFIAELLKKTFSDKPNDDVKDLEPVNSFNSRARILLDAIETKQGALDRELRAALLDCLQDDELKERIVTATATSVRNMLGDNFSREMSRMYMPILQQAHRSVCTQLKRHVEDAFAELEANSAQLTNSMCRMSRMLRRELDRHHALLDRDRFSYMRYIIEETLQKEIREWRHLAVEVLCANAEEDDGAHWAERGATPPPLEFPVCTPQSDHSEISIIDQMMTAAEINKEIEDGDLNAAFERALSAADLSLVMAACRTADPGEVFAPCRLKQSTLLSLAQQLPTDMVQETQLKCKYLEEALINLNPMHPATSAHLPLVVGEIRKHLTNFLNKYPSHIAKKRISLIVMTADSLLK